MGDLDQNAVSGVPPDSPGERLDSWKEIALFLKREVSTVQRWEKQEALPVHRHMHGERGTVYAYKSEVAAWSNNRRAVTGSEELVAPGTANSIPSTDHEVVEKRNMGIALTSVLVLVSVAAAAIGIRYFVSRKKPMRFQNFTLSRFTDTGSAASAAISPDGNYIVHVQRDGGQQSLWLRNVPTNSNTQIAPASDELYGNLEFSPDGNFIYFLGVEEHENGIFTLFRVPVLGGSRERVIHDINSRISYSPDRSHVVFTRYKRDQREFDLIIANADGSGERIVAKQIAGATSPAWSPDGKWIVWAKFKPGLSAGSVLDLVDPTTGKEKTLIKSNAIMAVPQWLPDQSGILVLTMDMDAPASLRRYQIGMVSYPQGVLRTITNDTNYYVSISLSADGKAIATVQSQHFATLQTEAYDGKNPGNPATISSRPPTTNLSWTSDRNLVVEQEDAIYRMDSTGGNRLRITPEHSYPFASISCGQGKDVIFTSVLGGGDGPHHMWRMDASGRNLKLLPNGTNGDPVVCSPDGKWLVYDTRDSGKIVSKKIPVDGGAPILLSEVPPSTCCAISPDGKDLAFGMQPTPGGPNVIKILDFETLQLKRTIAGLPKIPGGVEYTPDGKAFVYPIYDHGSYALWIQPLDGSLGRRVTEFATDPISRFAWSQDGKTLALIRSHSDSDVVLLRETPPAN